MQKRGEMGTPHKSSFTLSSWCCFAIIWVGKTRKVWSTNKPENLPSTSSMAPELDLKLDQLAWAKRFSRRSSTTVPSPLNGNKGELPHRAVCEDKDCTAFCTFNIEISLYRSLLLLFIITIISPLWSRWGQPGSWVHLLVASGSQLWALNLVHIGFIMTPSGNQIRPRAGLHYQFLYLYIIVRCCSSETQWSPLDFCVLFILCEYSLWKNFCFYFIIKSRNLAYCGSDWGFPSLLVVNFFVGVCVGIIFISEKFHSGFSSDRHVYQLESV